jgi:maltose O-acetyltransferase
MGTIEIVKEMIWDVLVNYVAASVFLPNRIRAMMYRGLGILTMTNDIRSRCNFRGTDIKIGQGSFINYSCVMEDHVEIGDNCMIAFDVILCTSTHKFGPHGKRGGESVNLPIKIGDGCWIGARVTVLPGVTIGDGCIIAAGAVVCSDCEADGLYAGVPARRIKELSVADDRSLYAIDS